MAEPGAWVKRGWALRTPLEPVASAGALAYWIEKSTGDPWTFDDLLRLIGGALDEQRDLPTALERWAFEVATGRRARPIKRGPPSNHWNDAVVWAFVELLSGEGGSMSQAEAFRQVGDVIHRSPEAVASARRRARSM